MNDIEGRGIDEYDGMYGGSKDILELKFIFYWLYFCQGRVNDVEATDAAKGCIALLGLQLVFMFHFELFWRWFDHLTVVSAVTRFLSLSLPFLCYPPWQRLLLSRLEYLFSVENLRGRFELLCSGVKVHLHIGRLVSFF